MYCISNSCWSTYLKKKIISHLVNGQWTKLNEDDLKDFVKTVSNLKVRTDSSLSVFY